LVLKTDQNNDGVLSLNELEELITSLPPFDEIKAPTSTPNYTEDLLSAKLPPPASTLYNSSSFEGYPYPVILANGRNRLESFAADFAGLSSADVFKEVAFKTRGLGSLLIELFLKRGDGLEVFLPPKQQLQRDSFTAWTRVLPLTKEWEKTDFSRAAVLGDVAEEQCRMAIVRMLYRYSFVMVRFSNRYRHHGLTYCRARHLSSSSSQL
jgi:hypothetical protein